MKKCHIKIEDPIEYLKCLLKTYDDTIVFLDRNVSWDILQEVLTPSSAKFVIYPSKSKNSYYARSIPSWDGWKYCKIPFPIEWYRLSENGVVIFPEFIACGTIDNECCIVITKTVESAFKACEAAISIFHDK